MLPAMKPVFSEALVVAVLGIAAGLVANLISPRGLSLTRDYFPAQSNAMTVAPPAGAMSRNEKVPSTAAVPVPAGVQSKNGGTTITTAQALEFFRNPEYLQELIVFVDAR